LKIEVKKKIDVIFDFRLARDRQNFISGPQCDPDFEKNSGWVLKKP
jgi:hypothetical protein